MVRFKNIRPKLECPFCHQMNASMRKYYLLYTIRANNDWAYQVREMHQIMCAACKADMLADDNYFRTRKEAERTMVTLSLLTP